MTRPNFTVIIPVYNGVATLARAIESVLDQRYSAHEIIVVDDGSTDATPQVAAGFGGHVRYLRQDNRGVSAARNAGAAVASGDWLAFLDADDWYYPQRLQVHAEWIMRDPAIGFLTGDYDYVRTDGSRIAGSMEQHESGMAMQRKAAGAQEVIMTDDEFESFVADHFGDTHTLSLPTQTFRKIGGYPVGFRVCEDVFFLIRLCAASKRVGVICRPIAAYVIHDGSATRKDPLRAQYDNVRTLKAVKQESRAYPPAVSRGVASRLRQGRLNLGYALSRAGRRKDAVKAVLPNLWESSGLVGLRDVLSMVRG